MHTYLNLFRSDKSSKIKSNVVENRMYFSTSETPISTNATAKYLKILVNKTENSSPLSLDLGLGMGTWLYTDLIT